MNFEINSESVGELAHEELITQKYLIAAQAKRIEPMEPLEV